MRIGVMQPYFLPYIGYWQLINSVDKFIVYNDFQFMKSGWINRNRILLNKKSFFITIPLKSGSYSLRISERFISNQYFDKDVDRLLQIIRLASRKAPYFKETMPVVERCLLYEEKNLSGFISNSIQLISEYLGITTEILFLSDLEIDPSLKGQERVIEICKNFSATLYINAIGGFELYDSKSFESNGIKLNFLKSIPNQYKQFNNEFIPNLSIVDVMMFNSKDDVKKMLNMYELINGTWHCREFA
ncbi:hypothetical protein EQO05_01620 [Methanosarcina sp. MSH10X1]|uniref:WbqC family protein n=1 Tax=Methanosarcina sp. MSH10X1 TaxID=2507075 RepID=UPI000FFC9AC8|nr:WbqC family protein [Methanosarcina sp. MSH10X1]RXA21944.1 hypothetical protein EQO05_01620 [Methanosarcina sp. MSH10X1]